MERAWLFLPLALLLGLAVVIGVSLLVYRPDRPVANLVPGSSTGPEFVVQVIRPRAGLPLGGIVSPRLFGLEATLGFGSTSPGAFVVDVGPGRIELGADDGNLVLLLDADGRVSPETELIFDLLFQDRLRSVRCWPGDPVIGTFGASQLAGSKELSGNFDIELAHCEDAETGDPLGWPARPLVLHGSFDRLPPGLGVTYERR